MSATPGQWLRMLSCVLPLAENFPVRVSLPWR